MKRKVLAVFVALVLVACAVAYAQSPVLTYGVDRGGNLTKLVTDSSGRLLTGTGEQIYYASTTVASDALDCASTGAHCTEVCKSDLNLSGYSNISIFIKPSNLGTRSSFILVSPDNNNWEVWDSVTFDNITADTVKSIQISGNSRPYIKVWTTLTAAFANPVECWIWGNTL